MHPITGKKLAGPNAETGQPVEIGEDAYQDRLFSFFLRIWLHLKSMRSEEWRQLWLRQILYCTQMVAAPKS